MRRGFEYEHIGVDDPVKVFLAFFTPAVAALYPSEELWMPIDAFAVTFRGFLALSVFDLGLFVSRYVLVPPLDSFCHFMPQSLRLSLVLLLQGPC